MVRGAREFQGEGAAHAKPGGTKELGPRAFEERNKDQSGSWLI